jgi:hypothetical protein
LEEVAWLNEHVGQVQSAQNDIRARTPRRASCSGKSSARMRTTTPRNSRTCARCAIRTYKSSRKLNLRPGEAACMGCGEKLTYCGKPFTADLS